jgi:hypothetical protein
MIFRMVLYELFSTFFFCYAVVVALWLNCVNAVKKQNFLRLPLRGFGACGEQVSGWFLLFG